MPATAVSLRVTGTVARADRGLLILTERLESHDTFLIGFLEIDCQHPTAVRILTFDDITVLRLGTHPGLISNTWSGTLHLPHGQRPRLIPHDLAATVGQQRRDLTTLTSAELRYALTFLAEATTAQIRSDRIAAIVTALPPARQGDQ